MYHVLNTQMITPVLIRYRYIPKGNSKFGSFTFENIAGQPTLQYRLYIQGKETWDTLVTAPPAAKSENTLGALWDRFKVQLSSGDVDRAA